MSTTRYKTELNRFLSNHVGEAVRDTDPIFELGLVDSMFAVQIVHFIERSYGVVIGPEDLDMKHFRSVEAMADLVTRKQAPRGGRTP